MKNLFKKFQKILLVEIEDLKGDLDLFIEVINDRHEHRLITDYVYQENLAILRNEVLGLEDCLHGCDDLEDENAETVMEIAESLKHHLRERLTYRGYVPALFSLLEKRIDRIAGYLSVGEGSEPERSESSSARSASNT